MINTESGKCISLKKNCDFKLVYDKGTSKADRLLVMYIKENGLPYNRLGVSVSKKVGNSVVRHRVKRLVKEFYRINVDKFTKGYDMIVVARLKAADAGFHSIGVSLVYLGKKLGIIC